MVIDLKKCVGCYACTVACKAENDAQIPEEKFWHRIFEVEKGEYPNVKKIFIPMPCFHCKEPICVAVCPTGASYKREKDGLVLIDYNKCIYCQYCVFSCPYGARVPNEKERIVTKCTFCVQRVEKFKVPACVETCIGNARYFGDLDNPNSEVSQLIKERGGIQFSEELDPSVFYLPLKPINTAKPTKKTKPTVTKPTKPEKEKPKEEKQEQKPATPYVQLGCG